MLFAELHRREIYGVVEGLGRVRVRFRGTDRMLSNAGGFSRALVGAGVLLKDFGVWAEAATKLLRAGCEGQARALGIPVRYLGPWRRGQGCAGAADCPGAGNRTGRVRLHAQRC